MLKAHLAWAETKIDEVLTKVEAQLDEESKGCLKVAMLATDWIPFRRAVRIDRAIAEVVAGESLEETLRQMGRHSAVVNLGGSTRSSSKTSRIAFSSG
jgi:predicted site-specific integrase-resolvase